ncbi:hypothetical protein CRE_17046 [Caenorhabditis remanei]|uniref:Uncharacterized protein n=1 Tax=Caenorhabditis remanei TaxID=31234 RepID=E3M9W1_CAERE|nr:hypothetical protein CRE_17046 [Caenorhabditis remanei]
MASNSNVKGTMANYGRIRGILLDQIRENNSFGSVWTEHGIMHLSSPFFADYQQVGWIEGQHQVHWGQHQIGPKYYIIVDPWNPQMLDGKLILFGLLEIKSNPNLLAGFFYQLHSGIGYIKVPFSSANFHHAESMSFRFDATLVLLDDPEKVENTSSTCFWAVKTLVPNESRISSIFHLTPQFAPENTRTEPIVNDSSEVPVADEPTHCRAIIMKVLQDRNYLVWVTEKKAVAIMEPWVFERYIFQKLRIFRWHREFYRDIHTPLGVEFSAVVLPYTSHVNRDILWEVVQLNHDFTVPVYKYRTVNANEIEIEMVANFAHTKQFPIGSALVRSKEKATLALNDTVFDFERVEHNQNQFIQKFKECTRLKVWCRIKNQSFAIRNEEPATLHRKLLTIFSMSEKEESESARQRRKELTQMRLEFNARENQCLFYNRYAPAQPTITHERRRSDRPSEQSASNGNESRNDNNKVHQTNFVRFDPWGRNNLPDSDDEEDYRGPSTSTGIREPRDCQNKHYRR